MRTVYGLKMFTLEDIISKIGGRPTICNYLKEHPSILDKFEEDEKLVIDTSIHENFPIYNMAKCLKFVFVSIDLLEERLILDKFIPNLEEIKDILVTVSRAEKVERMVTKHINSYEKYSDVYSGDNLAEARCFMFVYDKDDDKLIDVFTAIPSEIISFLTEPIEYKCSVCSTIQSTDNSSFDKFIPNMFYNVNNNSIDYRCSDHIEEGYVHVGE